MDNTAPHISRELQIFFNEHNKTCTNCGKKFQEDMVANVGYLVEKTPAVLCDECSHLLTETVVRYCWMEPEYDEVVHTSLLWRYMDLGKFISLIGKKKLYFASLESFEDLFEGAKGVAYRKDKWDSFYLDVFKQAIQTAPGINKKELTQQYIEENALRLLSEMDNLGKRGRKITFVSCWYCNQYESEAMWKLYSGNIKNAIAIQTTYQQLYEALGRDPSIEIGKVRYIDYAKRFSSVNGSHWYKRKSFEYEQEVRAVVKDFNASGNGIEKDIDVEKLINAVYISPYAPKWFMDVVCDVLKKYGLDKPVCHSEMKETPFY